MNLRFPSDPVIETVETTTPPLIETIETPTPQPETVEEFSNVFVFLKDEFILKKQNNKHKPTELFKEYKKYCLSKNIVKVARKTDFVEKLKNVGIGSFSDR